MVLGVLETADKALCRALFPYQADAGASLLGSFFNRDYWTKKVHEIENHYLLDLLKEKFPWAISHVRFDRDTGEFLVVPREEDMPDFQISSAHWLFAPLDTNQYPTILSPRRRVEIETLVTQTLATAMLAHFLKDLRVDENTSPKILQNIYLLLHLCTINGITVLNRDGESVFSEWQIDLDTYYICRATAKTPNGENLHRFIQQHYSSRLTGDKMLPILVAFERRFGHRIKKDIHFDLVFKYIAKSAAFSLGRAR